MSPFVLAMVGCGGPSHVAVVPHAAGLAVGSPVTARGVPVGQVDSVAVEPDGVHVTFGFTGDPVALHADACVRVLPSAGGATLAVDPGEAGDLGEAQLRPCEVGIVELTAAVEALVGAAAVGAREAGEQAGAAARGFTEGLRDGLGDPRAFGRDVGTLAREVEGGLEEGLAPPRP